MILKITKSRLCCSARDARKTLPLSCVSHCASEGFRDSLSPWKHLKEQKGCKFTSASNQSCNNNFAFLSNHSSRFPNQTNIISQFQTSVPFRSLKLLQTYTKELKWNLQTVLNEVQSQELGLMTLMSPSQLSTFYDFTIWHFGPFEVYGKLPSHWVELSFSDVINLSWMGNRLKYIF